MHTFTTRQLKKLVEALGGEVGNFPSMTDDPKVNYAID